MSKEDKSRRWKKEIVTYNTRSSKLKKGLWNLVCILCETTGMIWCVLVYKTSSRLHVQHVTLTLLWQKNWVRPRIETKTLFERKRGQKGTGLLQDGGMD